MCRSLGIEVERGLHEAVVVFHCVVYAETWAEIAGNWVENEMLEKNGRSNVDTLNQE